MTKSMRRLAAAATVAVATLGGGCAAGGWDDVLYGGGTRNAYDVTGEVNRVDSRSRTLEIREDRGRAVRIRYDGSTRVVYQGRRYSATSLERGDFVTVRVQRDRRGDLYARNVVVRRDSRGRSPGQAAPSARRQTLDGRVVRVQQREGRFELRTGRSSVWVSLPYNASSSVRDRFRRLRQGDDVRVEGVWLNDRRFEVQRFR
jgi:hypothetical protein